MPRAHRAGARLAVLASLPRLAVIVVDEEHDPAYKQQEGLRYSARDLAIYRAKQLGLPVVLGSATPSLESWWQADQGRYKRLTLSRRAVADAVLPTVRLIDLEEETPARTRFRRRIIGAADRGAESAARARRAKSRIPEPARLRAAARVRRLRLGRRLSALQRLRRFAQA